MSDSESVSSSASSVAAPSPAETVKEIRKQLKAASDLLKQLAAATKGLKAPKKKAASAAPRKSSEGMRKWQAFQKFVWDQLKEDNPAAPFKEAMKTAGARWEKGEPISSKDKRRFAAWLEEHPIPTAEEALEAAAAKKAAAEKEKAEKKAKREAEKAAKAKEKAKAAKAKPAAKPKAKAADSSDSESEEEAPKPKAKAAAKAKAKAADSSDSESEEEAPKPKAKAAPKAKKAPKAAAESSSESEEEAKPKKSKPASPKLSPSSSAAVAAAAAPAAAPALALMPTVDFQGKTYYINRKTRNLYDPESEDIAFVGRLSADGKSIDFEVGEKDPDVPAAAADAE
jgi:hypothetical protein